ncbi:MAG: efflux RND transporter permease subunit [Prevotellaceae bacterium]|jgi:multidrug efflux pump subunit AcrB|nr:efflux RND transporter permease subunit [Prevotellaceae bacterium]
MNETASDNRTKTGRISSFSIITVFSSLLLLGLFFIPLLPIKLNPTRNMPEVRVSFRIPGQSARVVEMEVTSKLEAMLSRMKGVKGVTSTSGNGSGEVRVSLNKHVDLDIARFEVSTIVRQTWPSLPKGTSYPAISMSGGSNNSSTRPFLQYTLHAPLSPGMIQEYADENIRPALAEIRGINKVNLYGASRMIRKLEYNYVQLQNLDVSVGDIRTAIQTYLSREFLGIGRIDGEGSDQWIRLALVPEFIGYEFDASKIQVKNSNDKIIYLDQLVKVTLEEEEISSHFRINGLNTISMSIVAEEFANQIQLSKEIKAKLEMMRESFPKGYELHLSYDASEYLNAELDKIYFRSGLTLLILICFVVLIYRNWKYSLLILVSLIANISIAIIFYYLLELEIHLFSLAGITISLSLIIDNAIVMSDQIIQRGNKKAFLAILTATLTTVASLLVIFFMDEKVKLNLMDFAWVIIINLMVSLAIALFFVPALVEKLRITKRIPKKRKRKKRLMRKRIIVYIDRIYERIISFTCRRRAWFVVLLIFAFGIPVYLLPEKIQVRTLSGRWYVNTEPNFWGRLYNNTLGSAFYKEHVKPVTDVAFGGTMRLFVQKVREGGYYSGHKEETMISATSHMPNGTTLPQIDFLVKKMEDYIAAYPEVRQFETSINNARDANIRIYFVKEHQRSAFPYKLKNNLIRKAIELGGGAWIISGLGEGFSNEHRDYAGNNQVKLLGYNYDDLNVMTYEFRDTLLSHRRIKEVFVDSKYINYKPDYMEYSFALNMERLIQENISPYSLFNSLNPLFERNAHIATWNNGKRNEDIRIYSKQSGELDIWNLKHYPGMIKEKMFKLPEMATVVKGQFPQDIAKENQQYKLCLQYDYIGNYEQARRYLDRNIKNFVEKAPLGYKIAPESSNWNWWGGNEMNKQYLLLLMIIVIMYFTTSILFNSLKQPLIIMFIIPVTYIGIFLTFYLFKLNFDQGGFASFILLSGITINSNIYIINEYNIIRQHRNISPLKAYLKAWNVKVRPIFLTVVSTILGFIPFMIGYKESFWFPLAAGTIGGLTVSLISTFFFLPMFMGIVKRRKTKRLER